MTLRLSADALRLRLSADDLRRLAEAGAVTGEVAVAPGLALRYALRTAAVDRLGAELDGAALTVRLPRDWVAAWAAGDRVGFEGTQEAGDGRRLRILVEKDLGCRH